MKLLKLFIILIHFTKSFSLGSNINKADKLKVLLCRHKFNNIYVKNIGTYDSVKLINDWKLKNKENKEYRYILDQAIRSMSNDENIFTISFTIKNMNDKIINSLQENTNNQPNYMLLHLMLNDEIHFLDIIENSDNLKLLDNALEEYHIFLLKNGLKPKYYGLKSNENTIRYFLNVNLLNLLDETKNELIYLQNNKYINFLEKDSIIKRNNLNKLKNYAANTNNNNNTTNTTIIDTEFTK